MNTRDFDYGIGDDIDVAVQRIRAEIVEGIRRAAMVELDAPPPVRRAYEKAMLIAQAAR